MDNIGWREKLDQFKIPIALSILGLVLIIGGIFTSGLNKQKSKDLPVGRQDFPKESLVSPAKNISIDVSGAVKKPGVYQLLDGSRIDAAIAAAGGFSEGANTEYISKYLNMAQKLSDGTKVYVPSQKDASSVNASLSGVAGVSANAKVNINTATQAELEALSGIGPGYAAKIISGRPYQTAEDLLNKKIVGKSVFEKIKDQLVVY